MSEAPEQRAERQRERGYDAFRTGLMEGVLQPGQYLSQREIGALTGLPERAVRELIVHLLNDGLLETARQRGFRVASVDIALIRNAFQLRRFIECGAVMEFCVSADAAELAAHRRAHEEILADVTDQPAPEFRERFYAVDRELHEAIIAALKNPLIENVYRVNSVKIRLIRRTHIRAERFMERTMREHLAIIAACEARDRFAAVDAMGVHIDNTMRRVMGLN
jgi:DNA-binding GntR family transcriptional regulator